MSCRTVIWQLSLTETPDVAVASQALQPPAPNDAGAPGHKAPAQGDKGFNSWANTDDSFDKYRHGVVGGGAAIFSRSLSLVLSSLSTCLSNLFFLYFVFFFPTTSFCLFLSLWFSISPSLCTFFILSCVSLDQTGEALHELPFYLFHICNCQKEDCYFRSCLCFVVLMESQIEEVVLKASWPLCGDTNNVSCSLGSPRQLKMALQVRETWCHLDGTVLRGAVKTVLAWGGNWSRASAKLPPAVSVT